MINLKLEEVDRMIGEFDEYGRWHNYHRATIPLYELDFWCTISDRYGDGHLFHTLPDDPVNLFPVRREKDKI